MSAGPDKLDPLVAQYLLASRAENTRRAYESDLKRFAAWGGNIPSTSDEIVRYLAQHGSALRPSTLRRHVAAIASAHRDRGVTDVTKAPIVGRVLQGIQRSHGSKPHQKTPLLLEQLAEIVAAVPPNGSAIRDKAILLVGFFGALRRTEIVSLEARDIQMLSAGAEICIRRSKTDQTGQGRVAFLAARHDAMCPVAALTKLLAQIGAAFSGPLFVSRSGENRLNARSIARIVKRLVATIGLNPYCYAGHSLRAGFVTSASMAGYSTPLIAIQTGHRSIKSLGAYVRPENFPVLRPTAYDEYRASSAAPVSAGPDSQRQERTRARIR